MKSFILLILILSCLFATAASDSEHQNCDQNLRVIVDGFGRQNQFVVDVLTKAAALATVAFKIPPAVIVKPTTFGPTQARNRTIELDRVFAPQPNDERLQEQRKGAMPVHEFTHILFKNNFEIRNPGLYDLVASQGIRTYDYMYHMPYEELFADAFAVIFVGDPNAMYNSLRNLHDLRGTPIDPAVPPRSFVLDVPLDKLEEMRFIEHVIFHPTRVHFWKRVKDLDQLAQLRTLDLLFEAILSEIELNHNRGREFETTPISVLNGRLIEKFDAALVAAPPK